MPGPDAPSVPIEFVAQSILVLRGKRVLLDRDLAKLYQVRPTALRQQVRRNLNRFPDDFMLQLTPGEAQLMVSQNVTPSAKYFGGSMPYAFTQEGIAMLSSVLTSQRAAQVNVSIMRAFVKLREAMASNRELASRLDHMEESVLETLSAHDRKLETHEQAITGIFKALRELMNPPVTRAIGFTANLGTKHSEKN